MTSRSMETGADRRDDRDIGPNPELGLRPLSPAAETDPSQPMPDAASSSQLSNSSTKPFPLPVKPFTPEDETALRESLKRCSPSTFEAAVQFRRTGNPEHM